MSVITKKVICPRTGKRGFSSELDARLSLLRITDDQERDKIPVRVYRCECTRWHTTSRRNHEAARPHLEKATKDRTATFERIHQAAIKTNTSS